MSDPYPNESASSIYTHLRTLSNTIGDLGDIVSSLQFSASLTEFTDPTMPLSSSPPGSLRRRFLRIISFGRYSSHSADDTEPLNKSYDTGRRHSAPPNLNINATEVTADQHVSAAVHNSPRSSDSAQTTIIHERSPNAVSFLEAFRNQHPDYYAVAPDFDTTTDTNTETGRGQGPRDSSPRTSTRIQGRRHTVSRLDPIHIGLVHCDNCGGYWEYNHIYCPRCAGRTLRHDYGTGGHGPATTNDAEIGASTWDNNAEGPISGTVEESWTTTTTSSEVHTTSKIARNSTPEPGAEPPSAADPSAADPSLRHPNLGVRVCCDGVPHAPRVSRCCCGNPWTHNIAPAGFWVLPASVGTQPCCTGRFPTTAAVVFGGPVPAMPACECEQLGTDHVCLRRWGLEWVEFNENEIDDKRKDEGNGLFRAIGWVGRVLSWFCCC